MVNRTEYIQFTPIIYIIVICNILSCIPEAILLFGFIDQKIAFSYFIVVFEHSNSLYRFYVIVVVKYIYSRSVAFGDILFRNFKVE